MTESDWYYARDGHQVGPMHFSALQQLAASGELQAGDLVWNEGMTQWSPASAVAGLFPAAAIPVESIPAEPIAAVAQAVQGPSLNYLSPLDEPFRFAGFWIRFVAWMIDWILLSLAGRAIGVGFTVFPITQGHGRYGSSRDAADLVAMVLLPWLYYALLESSPWQATLGKRLLGLRVIDFNGAPIGFGRATARYFGKYLSYLIFGIGYAMIGFTALKQGLHDMVASTYVVKRR